MNILHIKNILRDYRVISRILNVKFFVIIYCVALTLVLVFTMILNHDFIWFMVVPLLSELFPSMFCRLYTRYNYNILSGMPIQIKNIATFPYVLSAFILSLSTLLSVGSTIFLGREVEIITLVMVYSLILFFGNIVGRFIYYMDMILLNKNNGTVYYISLFFGNILFCGLAGGVLGVLEYAKLPETLLSNIKLITIAAAFIGFVLTQIFFPKITLKRIKQ